MKAGLIWVVSCLVSCAPDSNLNRDRASLIVTPANDVAQSAGRPTEGTNVRVARRQERGATCDDAESALMQCRVGSRTVSICAGVDRASQSYAQYRSGTPQNVELEYPGNSTSSAPIRWARTSYAGGGEIQYRFFNGGYEYIVYDRTVRAGVDRRGRPVPRFEAGMVVRRGGSVQSHLRCDNASEAGRGYTEPSDFMPEGEFVALGE